jgi:allantoin racemase
MSARILLVNPNTTVSMTEGMADAARAAARPGTEIDAATVEGSVPFIDGWYDETVAAAAVARLVSERAGTFDAAILACFGDPGLYAARELTDAPVVGIAEASFLLAMSLGHRFGIVSTVDRATPATWDLLRHYGIEARCAAVEPSEAEVLELDDDASGAIDRMEAAGARAIAAGAEVLCMGCGAMVSIRAELERRLHVPVVEAVPAAVAHAESLLSLGLRTSKVRSFAPPATILR